MILQKLAAVLLIIAGIFTTCNSQPQKRTNEEILGDEVWMEVPDSANAKAAVREAHVLTILYEALCPDSESFMVQIGPIFEELKEFIQLEFVPFGLTKLQCGQKVNGTCIDPMFTCKHGTSGCEANKMHDCVLKHSLSLDQKLNFILCTMGPHKETIDTCLYSLRYNLNDIDQCMNFDEGTNLQLQSYDMTHRHTPTAVPLILIDGEDIEEYQEKALKDFRIFICGLLTNQYNLFNKNNAPSMCRTKEVFSSLTT